MLRSSILKRLTPFVIAGALVTASQPVGAQSVLDRIKRAAEDASKKAEEAKKAADAKKAAEEAAKRGATPAVPGGGNPNANSPNAATPAQPGGRGANAGPSNGPAIVGEGRRVGAGVRAAAEFCRRSEGRTCRGDRPAWQPCRGRARRRGRASIRRNQRRRQQWVGVQPGRVTPGVHRATGRGVCIHGG